MNIRLQSLLTQKLAPVLLLDCTVLPGILGSTGPGGCHALDSAVTAGCCTLLTTWASLRCVLIAS